MQACCRGICYRQKYLHGNIQFYLQTIAFLKRYQRFKNILCKLEQSRLTGFNYLLSLTSNIQDFLSSLLLQEDRICLAVSKTNSLSYELKIRYFSKRFTPKQDNNATRMHGVTKSEKE